MEGVRVGKGARLSRVIVDKDVRIPDRTRIGGDAAHDRGLFAVTPGGVIVVPKGLPLDPPA